MEQNNLQQVNRPEEQMNGIALLWHDKKVLFLSSLVVLACILVISSMFIKKPESTVYTPTPIASPTPIPLPQNAYNNLSIASVSPEDGSTNTSLFATISATFSKPLSIAEQQHATVSLSPNTQGTVSWSQTNDTINFTPDIHLNTGTTYTVTLQYGVATKSWSFTTIADTNVSQEDQAAIQLQSDAAWGNWQNQVTTDYPWYDNLPLQTSDYFTYFDIDTKSFISDLYINKSDTAKMNQLKQSILQQLQSFGIDTTKYKFVWNITSS